MPLQRIGPDNSPQFFLLPTLFLMCLILIPQTVQGLQVQTGPFTLNLKGEKTWGTRFGLGDSRGFLGGNYPLNSFSLTQSLTVDLEGSIGDRLSIDADLSDQKAGYLQSFNLIYDGENWDGLLGDFKVDQKGGFTVYNKKLSGIRIEGLVDETEIETVFSRIEGIPETKIFYGKSSEAEVVYRLYSPDDPWKENPYGKNIRGLQYYDLEKDYVSGFMEFKLKFGTGPELWSLLENWELAYLQDELQENDSAALSSGQFTVVGEAKEEKLLLLTSTEGLLRGAIKDYISSYNEGKAEEEKKQYPFNEGTDSEAQFLSALQEKTELLQGEVDRFKLGSYKRNRFYYLGYKNIEEEKFSLEVRKGAEEEWEDVEDLVNYDYRLYPEEGVVELLFPALFFQDLEGKGLRATFRYQISGKTYMLGFSVAPDSEKVYLNGELLKRGTDYSIDYEVGALIIFRDIGSEDKIRVDYERARGGLGGFAEYKRNFYGFTATARPEKGVSIDLNVFRAQDLAPDELSPKATTMPNTHTVAGLVGQIEQNDWEATFKTAASLNRFPFDDNKRKNRPNRINAIASVQYRESTFHLFAHQNGLTVFDGESWNSYGTGDGLASQTVNDLIVLQDKVVFATEAGITVLQLEGETPFDRATNWKSYYESDRLPDGNTLALQKEGDYLWIGAKSGLIRTKLSSLGGGKEDVIWSRIELERGETAVSEIAFFGEEIYIGTPEGLFEGEKPEGERNLTLSLNRLSSKEITALSSGKRGVASATEDGITLYKEGTEKTLLANLPVHSLSGWGEGELWYGSEDGFASLEGKRKYGQGTISAVAKVGPAIWGGAEGRILGGTDYRLSLFRLEEDVQEFYNEETEIEGKDENRYFDIDPGRHTDRGVFLTGDLVRILDMGFAPLELNLGFDFVESSFTSIGRLAGEGRAGWNLGFSSQLSKLLKLNFTSDFGLERPKEESDEVELTNVNSLSLRRSGPITFSLDLSLSNPKAPRREWGFSTSLGGNLFQDWGGWQIGLTGDRVSYLNQERTEMEGELNSSLKLAPSPGLRVDLSHELPLPLTPEGEKDVLDWKIKYSHGLQFNDFPPLTLNLSGQGEFRKLLRLGSVEGEGEGGLTLKAKGIEGNGFTLTPFLDLNWREERAKRELEAKVSGRGEFNLLETRTDLSRKIEIYKRSERREITDRLSGETDLSLQEVRPTVDYDLSRTLLTHPLYGEREKFKFDLSMEVRQSNESWGQSMLLGANYSPDKGMTYRFNDDISLKRWNQFSPQLGLEGKYHYSTSEIELGAKGGLSYKPRKHWKISFQGGVGLGRTEAGVSFAGSYGGLTLAIQF